MNSRTILNVGLVVLFISYPFIVYFGLEHLNAKWIATLLVILGGARALSANTPTIMLWLGVAAAVTAATITFFSNSEMGLLLYPVLMNTMFLTAFTISYFYPPSIIERIARKTHPDLPPEGVAYTRKVTLVWSVFFLLNGSASLYTVFLNRDIWALYNGFVSYLLMGLLFAVEYFVRIKTQRQHND